MIRFERNGTSFPDFGAAAGALVGLVVAAVVAEMNQNHGGGLDDVYSNLFTFMLALPVGAVAGAIVGHKIADQSGSLRDFVFEPSFTQLEDYDLPPGLVGGLAALQMALVYPEKEKSAGEETALTLNLFVSEQGHVLDTRVVTENVGQAFGKAAMDAARKTKWTPARKGQAAVASTVTVTVTFKID